MKHSADAYLKFAFRNLNFAILLCALLLALSITAEAQQPGKIPRIGLLISASAAATSPFIDAFRQSMQELGYVEGKNFVPEVRWGEGSRPASRGKGGDDL